MAELTPLEDVRGVVLDTVSPTPSVRAVLHDALGLVPAEAITAPHDVPPFTNSAMDGFAVRSGDVLEVPTRLAVIGDVAAGHVAPVAVRSGTAVKIMTGAPLPEGADAVVAVEYTTEASGSVSIEIRPRPGDHVRPAGGDVAAGAVVVEPGVRLTPSHLGVLASLGIDRPEVHRRPSVAIMSTGDEVQPPSVHELRPGWIRDANRPLLTGLLTELGVDIVDFGIVPDDPALLEGTLRRAAAETDVVMTSGGVSMGEHDVVKQVLDDVGEIGLFRIAMQPAKPFAFGTIEGVPFFGLPGNPVSVFVSFEQFARPALLAMMGSRALFRPQLTGRLAEAVETDPAKKVFLRMRTCTEDGAWWAAPAGAQGSNVLSAAAAGDAFGVVPVGVGALAAGDPIVLEMFRWPERLDVSGAEVSRGR